MTTPTLPTNIVIDIKDKENVKRMYKAFNPRGSGPIVMARYVCALLEAIAREQGWYDELVLTASDPNFTKKLTPDD